MNKHMKFGLAAAAALPLVLILEDQDPPQDPQSPPHTIAPAPIPSLKPERVKRPTTIVFGAEDGAYILRPPIIGAANVLSDAETGVEFGRIRLVGIGVRPHGVDYQDVTLEEYGQWLAAGSPEDVDAFLESSR